jgi:ACS family hexuronate transporter-like MFS transporter
MFHASSPSAQPPIEPWRWGVVWLMFLATMINYMDRQALGATNQSISDEFKIVSQSQYAQVEFWFGFAYGLFQFPAGWLADRLSLRFLYAGALVVWSMAGFWTGMVHTFEGLLVCRCLLGVGEAFNWTCAVGVVRRIIPLESRGLANGLFHGGASIGAFLTPLLVNLILRLDPGAWRLVFQLIGGSGLVWVALWFLVVRGERAAAVEQRSTEPADAHAFETSTATIWDVLRGRRFWVAFGVSIAVNFAWHFCRIWLPRWLGRDMGYSQEDANWIQSCFFIAADVGSMGAGLLTLRLVRRGQSVAKARKRVLLITALLSLASIPAGLLADTTAALPFILLLGVGTMGGFPIFFALTQEISPRHTSLCLGICGASAWMVVAFATPLAGVLADALGSLTPCMMAVGCVPIVGAAIGWMWPEAKK